MKPIIFIILSSISILSTTHGSEASLNNDWSVQTLLAEGKAAYRDGNFDLVLKRAAQVELITKSDSMTKELKADTDLVRSIYLDVVISHYRKGLTGEFTSSSFFCAPPVPAEKMERIAAAKREYSDKIKTILESPPIPSPIFTLKSKD